MSSFLPLLANATEAAPKERPFIDFDGTTVVIMIIFVVMYFVLKRLIFLPYLQLRDLRQAEMAGKQQRAQKLHEEAQALTADYNKAISKERATLEKERTQLYNEVQKKNQELLDETRKHVQSQLDESREKLQSQLDMAKETIATQAEPLGHELASKVLGRKV